ncbi:hypothetical protein BJ170DRAFT_590783 [Xylariales sp. AK1849]|nr:hypothetical protein BJ170DRAFT_590783 [Xylariales sp. AK1849]
METFHQFPLLPFEIRCMVWEIILSAGSVTTVTSPASSSHSYSAKLQPLQWDPSTVGRVCHASRLLMTKSSERVELPPRVWHQTPTSKYHWVNFSTTTFYFGLDTTASRAIQELAGTSDYSRHHHLHQVYRLQIRYAAITFTTWFDTIESFGNLVYSYPALKVIFIYTSEEVFDIEPEVLEKHGCDDGDLPAIMCSGIRGHGGRLPSRAQMRDELSQVAGIRYRSIPRVIILPL